MEVYHMFHIGKAGKSAEPSCGLLAENDGQALRIASEMLRGQPAELWRGSRLIAGLTPWPTSPESKRIIVIKT